MVDRKEVEGISFPYPGTEKREGGKVVGIWGSPEHPVVMHISVGGALRVATKAERIAMRRLPQFEWVPRFEAQIHAAGHGPHPLDDYPLPADPPPPGDPVNYLAPAKSIKPSFADWLAFAGYNFARAAAPLTSPIRQAIIDLRAAMVYDSDTDRAPVSNLRNAIWDRLQPTLRSCGIVLPQSLFDQVWWLYCNPPFGSEWARSPESPDDTDRLWARHGLLEAARDALHLGPQQASLRRYGTDPTPP